MSGSNDGLEEDDRKELFRLSQPLLDESPAPTTNDELEANFLSRLFLLYVVPSLKKAEELDAGMEASDLSPLCGEDCAEACHAKLNDLWEAEVATNPKAPQTMFVLFRFCSDLMPVFILGSSLTPLSRSRALSRCRSSLRLLKVTRFRGSKVASLLLCSLG
jgi:hypothetical protein